MDLCFSNWFNSYFYIINLGNKHFVEIFSLLLHGLSFIRPLGPQSLEYLLSDFQGLVTNTCPAGSQLASFSLLCLSSHQWAQYDSIMPCPPLLSLSWTPPWPLTGPCQLYQPGACCPLQLLLNPSPRGLPTMAFINLFLLSGRNFLLKSK